MICGRLLVKYFMDISPDTSPVSHLTWKHQAVIENLELVAWKRDV